MNKQDEEQTRQLMVESNHVVDALTDIMLERNVKPIVASIALIQILVMNYKVLGVPKDAARESIMKGFEDFWNIVEKVG